MIGKRIMAAIGGRAWPGVITGTPFPGVAEFPSRDPQRAGQMVRRPTTYAEVITQRETNPANGPVRSYLVKSIEDLKWIGPRDANHEAVVGLDFDEDGTQISLTELDALVFESTLAFQAARTAAQVAAPTVQVEL